MVVDVRVTGAQQFAALGARLKVAGDGRELRLALFTAIRAAAKPMVETAKENAVETLPHRGGLNEWTANQKYAVRNRMAGRQAGVRIVATSKKRTSRSNMRLMDVSGMVRHPTFGRTANPQDWNTTRVTAGWFTHPISKQAPAVQVAVLAAMRMTSQKIAH